jgi:predicted metalloprotease
VEAHIRRPVRVVLVPDEVALEYYLLVPVALQLRQRRVDPVVLRLQGLSADTFRRVIATEGGAKVIGATRRVEDVVAAGTGIIRITTAREEV